MREETRQPHVEQEDANPILTGSERRPVSLLDTLLGSDSDEPSNIEEDGRHDKDDNETK